MSRRKPRLPFRALPLEERALPSSTPYGPLVRAYTFTEVLAFVRSADPVGALARTESAALFDLAASRVILNDAGASLVQFGLQPGVDPLIAVGALQARPDVAWSQPNYIFSGDPREYTPNDPQYGSQYALTKMAVNQAWDTETGDPSIVIAIADDGVAVAHPDLAPNLWVNAKEVANNGKDDDGNGFIDDLNGWDTAANDKTLNPVGSDSHGTHVAGIAAARTDNATGVSGVAGGGPNGDGARIMPIRWYGEASWTAAIIASTFAYAANNGAKLVNASYNFDGWAVGGVPDPAVEAGFNYSYGKGVLHFNSAGNTGSESPARRIFTQPLFVASTEADDTKSGFSSWGGYVDISAPGGGILSTLTDTNGTGVSYGNNSGTSMATPDAAGVAALIWSAHPTWSREQVVAQLLGTADNIDAVNPGLVGKLGAGRANAFRALNETLPAPRLGALLGLPAEGGSIPALPASFTLAAPMRFDPATAAGANFSLIGDGADDTFGTSDDVNIPLIVNGGAAYRVGTDGFAFTMGAAAPADRYRFRAASGGLRDPFNIALDGNGDGTAGDDFTRTFFISRQIDGVVYEDRDNDGGRDAGEPGLAGRVVYLDTNGNNTFDGPSFSDNVPVSIIDNATVSSKLTVAGFAGLATAVTVNLNITHTYTADLDARLIGPLGQKILLFSAVGGSGDNFINTTLDDAAGVSITAGAAPFTGSYQPQEPLSTFAGLSPNGTWTLEIEDTASFDIGTIDGWSLSFNSTPPEPFTVTDAVGQYIFTGLAANTYAVRHMLPAGWNAGAQPAAGTHTVSVSGPSSANPGRDFGELRANTAYGRVYQDLNLSGGYDSGDAPLAGWTVYSDTDGDSNFDSATSTKASTNVPVTINGSAVHTSTLTLSGFTGNLADLNVKLNINHAWDADVEATLISPGGQQVLLFGGVGGSADNFINTVLDDQAATSITSGTAPFTGTFRPEQPLANFNGASPNGTWTLQIIDTYPTADNGTLTAWSLEVTTAEPSTKSNADGTYALALTNGPHTLRRVVQAGYTPAEPAGGFHAVTMTAGQTVANRNFGQTLPVPPRVSALTVNDGSAQRSLVTSFKVTFSEAVTFPSGIGAAFQLQRTGPSGTTGAVNLNSVQSGSDVTLTFLAGGPVGTDPGGSLADGAYQLTIVAANVQGAAGKLDGDGNGIAGDNYATPLTGPGRLYRLFGDNDGDADVDAVDYGAFRGAFGGTSNLAFDNDGDADVDAVDYGQFSQRFGSAV